MRVPPRRCTASALSLLVCMQKNSYALLLLFFLCVSNGHLWRAVPSATELGKSPPETYLYRVKHGLLCSCFFRSLPRRHFGIILAADKSTSRSPVRLKSEEKSVGVKLECKLTFVYVADYSGTRCRSRREWTRASWKTLHPHIERHWAKVHQHGVRSVFRP